MLFFVKKIPLFSLTSRAFVNSVLFKQRFRNFHYSTVYCITKKYTKEHEWISLDNDRIGTIGITNYAQKALGDVVFVELPELGSTFVKGDSIGAVESVKSASEIYAPLSGEIIESNHLLLGNPGLINKCAESDGWICRMKIVDIQELNDLMDIDNYKIYCNE
ncbi:hypothetical protein PCANB_002958 [Pneumocystis canis]|nr:hypothetical protein PCK1_003130 [Pneumocystis canis]KAG5438107.1 hypothetical protein PCANB_002958 [Pneumocystis canis]